MLLSVHIVLLCHCLCLKKEEEVYI